MNINCVVLFSMSSRCKVDGWFGQTISYKNKAIKVKLILWEESKARNCCFMDNIAY